MVACSIYIYKYPSEKPWQILNLCQPANLPKTTQTSQSLALQCGYVYAAGAYLLRKDLEDAPTSSHAAE
jgi:hypothetical protein